MEFKIQNEEQFPLSYYCDQLSHNDVIEACFQDAYIYIYIYIYDN
jgi:hypothetical protein